jgi:integrase
LKSGKPSLQTPTFRQLALAYLKKLKTYHTQAWAKQVRWKINRYFKPLFYLEADTIRPVEDIQELLAKLKDSKKPWTLNELRKILNAIFNLGIKNDRITKNPVKKVDPFPIDDIPKYIPPEKDLLKVLRKATPRQRDQLLFIKNTMCRVRTSQKVARSDVNLKERWVILRTRKTRGGGEKSWKVPINSELRPVLASLLKNSTSEFLFPNANGTQQTKYPRWLKQLCKTARVKPFTFHAIRHFSATYAKNKGANTRGIQEILGHESSKTTDIYLQSLDETTRRVAETLAKPKKGTKKAVDNGQDFGQDFSSKAAKNGLKSRRITRAHTL